MTFGMMFGNRQNSTEEWSTDEDGDGDYDEDDEDEDDDDDDDDDYLSEDYYEECEHQRAAAAAAIEGVMESLDTPVWEPQVKQYSNMDLKEQASKERLFEIIDQQSEEDDDEDDEYEGEGEGDLQTTGSALEDRKLRLAKKKADKRRKQKVKKSVLRVEEAQSIKVSKDMMSKSIEAELNAPEAKR
jgi:hypothetical protein